MADDLRAALGPASFPWRRLLLPAEHGSWAFALEPLLLGLIACGSPAAAWIGLAVVLGFISRKPARFAFPAGSAHAGTPPLQNPARIVLAVLLFGLSAALLAAVATSRWAILLPLLVSVPPLLIVFLRERMGLTRSLASELVATGLCSAPVVSIALAANLPISSALALASINLARAWPSLLYVRAVLRQSRGETDGKAAAIFAQIAAPAWLACLSWQNFSPWPVVLVAAALSARALFFLLFGRFHLSAKQLGIMELGWGLAYVLSAALLWRV